MNKDLRQVFEAENGRLSSNRVVFLIGSFWNIAIATYMILSGHDSGDVLVYFSGVQGVLSGAKLIQRQLEKK
jgi:hypothetical protein